MSTIRTLFHSQPLRTPLRSLQGAVEIVNNLQCFNSSPKVSDALLLATLAPRCKNTRLKCERLASNRVKEGLKTSEDLIVFSLGSLGYYCQSGDWTRSSSLLIRLCEGLVRRGVIDKASVKKSLCL